MAEEEGWECRPRSLHGLNSSCAYIRHTPACEPESRINYLYLTFCTLPDEAAWVGYLLYVLWICYLFLAIGGLADNFFVVNLQALSHALSLSESVAGVTLLALGNGAADIFAAISAMGVPNGGQLAVSGLLGGAVFVVLAVVGCVVVLHGPVHVHFKSFMRDAVALLAALACLFFLLQDNRVRLWESLSILGLYVAYVAFVVGQHSAEAAAASAASTPAARAASRGLPGDPTALDVDYDFGVSDWADQGERSLLLPTPVDQLTSGIATEEDAQRHVVQETKFVDLDPIDPPHSAGTWALYLLGVPHDFGTASLLVRAYIVARAPAMLAFNLTVPVVNLDAQVNRGWNRTHALLICTLAPFAVAVIVAEDAFVLHTRESEGAFALPAALIAFVAGALVAVVVVFTTDSDGRREPRFHLLFALFGFAMGAVWLYALSNEVVGALRALGIGLRLSEGIIGVTFLSVGNGICDLISNLLVARKGLSRMAISAAFGAPVLNLLLGFSFASMYGLQKVESPYPLALDDQLICAFVALALAVVFVVLIATVGRPGALPSGAGYVLLTGYAAFVVCCLVFEIW